MKFTPKQQAEILEVARDAAYAAIKDSSLAANYKPVMQWEPSKTATPKRTGRPGYYRAISEGHGETHILSSWQAGTDREAKRLATAQGYEFREVEPRA